ncbi:hypothetical protein [Candidatus Methylobacter oryzae]|uniref:Head decoration protein n=1 Tax=Candidatus Methylobacter oryzae TaxID=2497749 RepID=A0ABY3CGL2_9GAMM|nr:hypothetical protein [Candidatus Methylobacter oryzae]TRX02916.1 hypothetical protein EKO24_001125 [Candidatus Methylobacter oryzae]
MILNEAMLDSVTAGAISSTVSASGVAAGSTFTQTTIDATTYAIALGKTLQTGAKGVVFAQGDLLALASGSSSSSSGTTGVSVDGTAITIGGQSYILVWTKDISTPGANVAIGHVRSVACCGPDAYASVQTSTFAPEGFNVSVNNINEVNTPVLSLAIGNAVVVSHP